jgi:hypothetical protein
MAASDTFLSKAIVSPRALEVCARASGFWSRSRATTRESHEFTCFSSAPVPKFGSLFRSPNANPFEKTRRFRMTSSTTASELLDKQAMLGFCPTIQTPLFFSSSFLVKSWSNCQKLSQNSLSWGGSRCDDSAIRQTKGTRPAHRPTCPPMPPPAAPRSCQASPLRPRPPNGLRQTAQTRGGRGRR